MLHYYCIHTTQPTLFGTRRQARVPYGQQSLFTREVRYEQKMDRYRGSMRHGFFNSLRRRRSCKFFSSFICFVFRDII